LFDANTSRDLRTIAASSAGYLPLGETPDVTNSPSMIVSRENAQGAVGHLELRSIIMRS
jgi:hypothetical protein